MKLINKILKEPAEDISGILADLERIRQHSDLINCVFRATGSSWLGVNIAGWSMFPDATIEIPQYHSSQVLSDNQMQEVCNKIVTLGFRYFVFHGFAPYQSKLIYGLKHLSKKIKVLFVHHGFVSELSDNEFQQQSIISFLSLIKEGMIDRIGVVKVGHDVLFEQLFGIKTYLLYNKVPVRRDPPCLRSSGKANIGVLVNNTYRKNLHVQAMAALLYDNALVHVLDKSQLYYLPQHERIVEHGMMGHHEFLVLLSSMDLNLHITYSESFGGQVFTESLGYGIPCLTGYSNGFLDYDPELKELLSVHESDDPVSISKRIYKLMPIRHQLSNKMIEYCKDMNIKADEMLQEFVCK